MNTPSPVAQRPLNGVFVLDLASGPMAAVGRQLVELGAQVLRIEPPGGAADRSAGRKAQGASIAFALDNCGKRAITLDLSDPAQRLQFDNLVDAADILIESNLGEDLGADLDLEGIRARRPDLVILSISDFGRQGITDSWRGTDAVFNALSGELSRSGIPGRAPALPPEGLATHCAAAQASFVVLAAYFHKLRTGRGDLLDFSIYEGAIQALDPGFGIAGSAAGGVPASKLPRGRVEARHQYPIIPCADGYVRICVLAPRQWQGMFEWLGRPDEFADPSFAKLSVRFGSPDLIPAIARHFAGKTRETLEKEGEAYGVPTASLLGIEEAVDNPQNRFREAFQPLEIAPGIVTGAPAGALIIDGQRMSAPARVPELEPWDSPVDVPLARRTIASQTGPAASSEMPLAGLKVLDLGVIVVGAEQGRLLGDLGAEVVKVENAAFPDGSRQSLDGSAISVAFAAGHRNKRGLGLNLRSPEGKALFLDLVRECDVLLSNFKPGTLEGLGFDEETLRAANPRLISIDSSAFGTSGPWSKRLGYGPLVRASSGLSAQWCYPGEPGSFCDALTVYPDHVAGRVGAVGVLALLIRRERTGLGGSGSVSQAEVIQSHMALEIATQQLVAAGIDIEDLEPDAPSGVFACAGDDDWCVVSVSGYAQWQRICGVICRADLAADTALATRAGRLAQRAKIDAALAQWFAQRTPREAQGILQDAGIAAGAMLRVAELPDEPHLKARNFLRSVTHPRIAQSFLLEARQVVAEGIPDAPQRPAPLSGEHSVDVVRDWLGMSEERVEELVEVGALEIAERVPAPACSR